MGIKIAVEIAMKFPVKYRSVRAGEELSELGHSPSGNAKSESDERQARGSRGAPDQKSCDARQLNSPCGRRLT